MKWLVLAGVALVGCAPQTQVTKAVAVANGGVWLERNVEGHKILMYCERRTVHPQCYTADFHHGPDTFWPRGLSAPWSFKPDSKNAKLPEGWVRDCPSDSTESPR